MIETVRVSQQAKDQLITLKRRTGIANWNVLCRWALCLSLAEETDPPMVDIVTDSSIEMTWRTFGGSESEVYKNILSFQCDFEDRDLDVFFKAHLHRGIGYLLESGSIQEFIELVVLTD